MGGKQSKYSKPTQKDFIGRGSYGEVYRSKRLLDGKIVAIKKIRVINPEEQKKILAEISQLERLSKDPHCHPNIVCIYDHEYSSKGINIIMELVEGDELDLINFKEHPDQYYTAFYEFAKGLQYLHEKKVVHRDIKPENAKFNGQQLKILDFGLSCTEPNCEGFKGTPVYADPLLYMQEISGSNYKSDIYALGLTFFSILTRRFPTHLKSVRDYTNQQLFNDFYNDNMASLKNFLNRQDTNFDFRLYYLLSRMMDPYDANNRPDINEVVETITKIKNREPEREPESDREIDRVVVQTVPKWRPSVTRVSDKPQRRNKYL